MILFLLFHTDIEGKCGWIIGGGGEGGTAPLQNYWGDLPPPTPPPVPTPMLILSFKGESDISSLNGHVEITTNTVIRLSIRGWSGGAMVLGKLPVPGRPTILITVGQGPTALAVGAGGGGLDIFTLIYHFFPLSPSLWETARYRLKYCLKGPSNPNQPTKTVDPQVGPHLCIWRESVRALTHVRKQIISMICHKEIKLKMIKVVTLGE